MASLNEHLAQLYAELALKDKVTESVQVCLNFAVTKVKSSIARDRTRIATTPVPLASYIQQRQAKSQSYEDNIREHRLKEAVRQKQELEQKLEQLQDNINSLAAVTESPPAQKVSLQSSKVRQEYFSEEEKRRQETAEFAKKLRQEQLELARRNRLREEELQRKVVAQLDQSQRRQEEELVRIQEEKARRLAELQDRARKRKLDLEERRRVASEETTRLRTQQYMHDRLSQDYVSHIVQTEQEKQQEALAKQKLSHQPVRLEDIQEHARKHDEIMREHFARKEAERKNKLIDSQISGLSQVKGSSFTQAVLSQEKQVKQEREQATEARKRLQEKKQRYALLVKEMFAPAIDPAKQKELEVIKEKLAHPVSHLHKNSTSRSLSDNPDMQVPYQPRKFKDNPMLPRPKPKREPIETVDYLKAQRDVRGNAQGFYGKLGVIQVQEDLDEGAKARIIKHQVDRLEKEARRREAQINLLSPTNPGALQAHEDLNDALISSIRAKLSLLK
jgi:hypothetical protein